MEQFKRKGDWEQEREIYRQAEKHDEVISYLRQIQAAFEQRELELTDLLRPIWPHLGIPGTKEARELTIAEVDRLLESSAVRCAWTDWKYTHLHLISRQEVEQRILPHLVEPSSDITYYGFYGYMASEWCVDGNETILVFCLCYWPI